jgi:hypothetical protein
MGLQEEFEVMGVRRVAFRWYFRAEVHEIPHIYKIIYSGRYLQSPERRK